MKDKILAELSHQIKPIIGQVRLSPDNDPSEKVRKAIDSTADSIVKIVKEEILEGVSSEDIKELLLYLASISDVFKADGEIQKSMGVDRHLDTARALNKVKNL